MGAVRTRMKVCTGKAEAGAEGRRTCAVFGAALVSRCTADFALGLVGLVEVGGWVEAL